METMETKAATMETAKVALRDAENLIERAYWKVKSIGGDDLALGISYEWHCLLKGLEKLDRLITDTINNLESPDGAADENDEKS